MFIDLRILKIKQGVPNDYGLSFDVHFALSYTIPVCYMYIITSQLTLANLVQFNM